MSRATYQTIKLGRGKHRSPDEGACVMELSSMLAGEPFSDHPACACRVIGAFLRAYNDAIDDTRRQDLYAYAARVVGSRAAPPIEDARRERIVAWTSELRRRRRWRLGTMWMLGAPTYATELDAVAGRAVREIVRLRGDLHAETLAFLDELLGIQGRGGYSTTVPAPGATIRTSTAGAL